MILLVIVAMVAIVACAGWIGYALTRSSLTAASEGVARPVQMWQAGRARVSLADDIATGVVGSLPAQTIEG